MMQKMKANNEPAAKTGLSVRDVAEMGVMLALIFIGKRAMDALPNIEIISLLFILFANHFGKKTLIVAEAFALLEGLIFGFNVWFIMYLYTWPGLILLILLLKGKVPVWGYAVISGFFGLFFGLFCSIPYFFISGIGGGFAWWIAGIPFDLIHCVGNFVICLVLYKPLDRALIMILKKSSNKNKETQKVSETEQL